MTKRIKGILFDLGDTLLDFGRVDVASVFEAGARLAYDYLKKLDQPLPPFAKFHRRQLWAFRWSYFKSRFTRREFNSLDVIGRLSLRMGHDLTDEQMAEMAWMWYEPLSRCATVEEGTRETLLKFRDEGLLLGLVSNTFVPGTILDRHLRQLGLLELLPIRVYSCDVRYRKPHRNIFDEALRQAGLLPAETLFVGDSPHADIKGANRAGLVPVLKDPDGRYAKASVKSLHRIRCLAELEQIVVQYNRRSIQAPTAQVPSAL
jgi:HAD superfamily hydrolase (TIGR01509 family)